MESEEQWSCRDFTQIKPRRPEGPAEEEWEEVESPFSFLWSGGGNELEVEEERRDHDDEENESPSNKMEEFEFSSVEEPAVVERLSPGSGISPADELFFKGQLLPLHLPPRIQMVKKLSLENTQQQSNGGRGSAATRNVHRNEEIITRVNALMQARFTRLFQPTKYSKFCMSTSSSDGAQWWDPRENNNNSSNNNTASFTSTDRDSSDSTSSRDSSGSSQDGFQEHHYTDSKGMSFLHNREVFSTGHPGEQRGASTWLRPPFKWKVLFGNAKKQRSPYDIAAEPKTHSMEAATDRTDMFPALSPVAPDRYYSDCSGELTPSGNLHLSSRNGAFIHGGHATDTDKYRGMDRARGYLQRYMKALNPSRSGKSDHHVDEGSRPIANTGGRSFPPFSQSFRISPKDISLKMNSSSSKRPPPASSAPPRPRVSTSSASSELHSAIQGAIAHCKESQKQSQPQDDDDVQQQLPSSNCNGGNHLQKVAAVN